MDKVGSSAFYKRISSEKTGSGMVVQVQLNGQHAVYEGHFPGKPVAPGAALMQMVLDELAHLLRDPVHVKTISQIKFLKVIDPTQITAFTLHIQFGDRKGERTFTCVGTGEGATYFKLNGVIG